MTYAEARADYEYLFEKIGEAYDMTGGYVVEATDVPRLLNSPTKHTAKKVFRDRIEYWFHVGPDEELALAHDWRNDPKVRRIAERYGMTDEFERLL